MDQYVQGICLIQLLKLTMQIKKLDCVIQRLNYSQWRNKVLGVYHTSTEYQDRAALTHQSCQSIEKILLIEGIVLVHSPLGPYKNYSCSHHRMWEITLGYTRKHRILWGGRDSQGWPPPALKWMTLTGIKPIALALLTQCYELTELNICIMFTGK